MSSTDDPADILSNLPSMSGTGTRRPPGDAVEAVIAALDDADIALEADDDSVTLLPDSGTEAIEMIEAEPILGGESQLEGAVDPVDLVRRRAKNESYREQIAQIERQLEGGQGDARAAALQHEIAVLKEQSSDEETDAALSYAAALAADPALRPNLWALRRLYYRRGMWPSLLRLLDIEAESAGSARERAELLVEKGHLLEDKLGDIDDAVECYRRAHALDVEALAPIAALEKVLIRKSGESTLTGGATRPSEELLAVYRALVSATKDPGRKVALLIEQARIEEIPTVDDKTGKPTADVSAALNHLHDAYDAGVDQLRVIDEIIRITAAAGRYADCLTALDVRAEILEMQAENASQPRKQHLIDQMVAIRRWQASLAKERVGNLDLAWQYLEKAREKSPADPLLFPDLLTVAEAQGQTEQVLSLLLERERELRIQRPEDAPPPIGLWLKQLVFLRQIGHTDDANQLEARIFGVAPSHVLLPVLRRRRALEQGDFSALATLFETEAEQTQNEKAAFDWAWACEALLAAADCAVQAGDLSRAEALLLRAESVLPKAGPETVPMRQLLDEQFEEVYVRSGREGLLVKLFERRLTDGVADETEAKLLREDLCELYSSALKSPDHAKPHREVLDQTATGDLRLLRQQVLRARFRGDLAEEEASLSSWVQACGKKTAPPIGDLLRWAELATKLGKNEQAIAVYDQVLTAQPGHSQALEELERLLLAQGKKEELSQLLRQQIERLSQQTGKHNDRAEQALHARLIDLIESELNLPDQASSLRKAVLQRVPGHLPSLFALAHHHRQSDDAAKLQTILSQLGEHAPTGTLRGEALLRLAELREDQGGKPQDVDALYERALQELPLPSLAGTHAAFGRYKAAMQQRQPEKLPEIFSNLQDSLPTEDPASRETAALLCEEGAGQLLLSPSPTDTSLTQADTQLHKTGVELSAVGNAISTETKVQLAVTRLLVNQRREDAKTQGDALVDLAELLLAQNDPGGRKIAGEFLVSAALAKTLYDDEPSRLSEAVRRLLLAYRALGDEPLVVVPLSDMLSDVALLEQVAHLPEVVSVLRARQAFCPEDETADRITWILLEAEALLVRSSADDTDETMAAKFRQAAAEAAFRALQLSPNSLPALALLRQATRPNDVEMDPLRVDPLAPESAARLRAYAQYTLRMASLLSDQAHRADLFTEAGQLLSRLGDIDGAAASLRAALEGRPFDENVLSELFALLNRRSEQTGDSGPLLETLDFRLSQVAFTEEEKAADQRWRAQLLSQRAALHLLSHQNTLAVADLESLLVLAPDHALSHRRLAALRAEHGDIAAAAAHYEHLLGLSKNQAEQFRLHQTLAELLFEHWPDKAAQHLEAALKQKLVSGAEPTVEQAQECVQLQRRLLRIKLRQGDKPHAYKTLKSMASEVPTGPEFSVLREQVLLEVAGVFERDLGDHVAAVLHLERLLEEQPLAVVALEKLWTLRVGSGETAKGTTVLHRARDEARKQIAAFSDVDQPLLPLPFAVLERVFAWQQLDVVHSLASQAAAQVNRVLSVEAKMPPPPTPRFPERSVGPPLRSLAFSSDTRNIILDMWQEVWETGTKLLGPDPAQLCQNPKDRLNAKKLPPNWAAVDSLAQRFGLGNTDLSIAYSLVVGKEREMCEALGPLLICGGAYAEPPSAWSQSQWFRLIRKLALLPDRLGALDCPPTDLLLFFAACCQLVGVSLPTLSQTERAKLDEKVRSLDRAIARRERSGLKNLSSRMQDLAGDSGKALLLEWQRLILRGSAFLATAITGNLAAAFDELKARLDADDEHDNRTARRLLVWSVSAELVELRRELGLTEKE